jgi:hypothetical protein
MNTLASILAFGCSWIPAFAGMTEGLMANDGQNPDI